MNLRQYTYEIFRTNDEANGNDVLNIGLPMFMDDLSKGKQNHCPVALDFPALKAEWDALTVDQRGELNKDIRLFINDHFQALCDAYPDRDKMLMVGHEAEQC